MDFEANLLDRCNLQASHLATWAAAIRHNLERRDVAVVAHYSQHAPITPQHHALRHAPRRSTDPADASPGAHQRQR